MVVSLFCHGTLSSSRFLPFTAACDIDKVAERVYCSAHRCQRCRRMRVYDARGRTISNQAAVFECKVGWPKCRRLSRRWRATVARNRDGDFNMDTMREKVPRICPILPPRCRLVLRMQSRAASGGGCSHDAAVRVVHKVSTCDTIDLFEARCARRYSRKLKVRGDLLERSMPRLRLRVL